MAMKLFIVLIHTVIAIELAPSSGVDITTLISPQSPSHGLQHEEVTMINNQVPVTHYEDVIELQKEESTPCHSTAVLIPILNQLISLLMQDPSNNKKVSRISALLQEYLKNMADNVQNKENINIANEETLRTGYYGGPTGHVKTKIVFKYDLPSINQPQCKDVFMRLIKSAYDSYVHLAKNPMCQNADIIQSMMKKSFGSPNNIDLGMNFTPNNKMPGTKEENSIYNLLNPQTDKNYGYQELNVNDPNIYGNYKPAHPNFDSNGGNIDPKFNILSNLMTEKSNVNDLNHYEYGKNPSLQTPHDLNFFKPESHPTENSKYDGNLNIYNIYGNDNRKELIPQKDDVNNLFLDNMNFKLDNLRVPENSWKPPVNILMQTINRNNQNPVESIMSILATAKTPEDKNEVPNNPLKSSYQQHPNMIQNAAPNQNTFYPYLPNQNNLMYQYGTPGSPTKQDVPNQKDPLNTIYKYISKQNGIPKQMDANPYLQNMYNNYLNTLTVLPNLHEIGGVPNALKLDPSSANVIELTFALKRATPLIYQPLYFVKFKMPYSTFLNNVKNLLITKPHLKNNQMKLYQELIALANLSDVSPDLKGFKREDISKLAYRNGELVTAKLFKDDSALNEQLRLIQSLNSGIGAEEILKLTNKNNIFFKTNDGVGNSSNILTGLPRYGKFNTPYYDLTNVGIGFNSGYEKQELPTNRELRPVSFSSFGTDLVRQKYLSGLPNNKYTYDTFALGAQG